MADTPIPATYLSASSFTVTGDRTAEFAPGVRVKADCGTDGIQYGTVSAAVYTTSTTVTLSMDSGALTSNLTGVLHGNDTPSSLTNHAYQHMLGARDVIAPADIGAMPADRTINTTAPLYGGGDLWSDLTIGISGASDAEAGVVELATAAEVIAGTDASRAVTPAGLAAAILAAIGIDPIDLPRNSDLGTAAYLDQTWLYASATWDAPSVATAAQTSTTVAVPGAEIGDKVFPSAAIALSGLNLRGEVTATDVVTLYLSNVTGSPVDLASATYYVAVLKRTPAR